jgi:putative CocE/NonD family hydrolase
MAIDARPLDQRPAEVHPNYGLNYLGELLEVPMTLAGPVSVSLHVSSDCPDTDFVAKLVEVLPDGRAALLMDGVVRAMYRDGATEPSRLSDGEIVRIKIPVGQIHHTVAAGSRLRVDVSSSNFPRRARNTNSGNPVLARDTDADKRVARNTVHHGENTPSFAELLVLPN